MRSKTRFSVTHKCVKYNFFTFFPNCQKLPKKVINIRVSNQQYKFYFQDLYGHTIYRCESYSTFLTN